MSTPASQHSQASSVPVYLFWNGEIVIEAPPAVVWPHVLNYPEWQKFSITDRVSGSPGEEGEVVLLKKIEAGFDFPPYHARTIRLEAGKRIVWKTYPHTAGDQSFFGIVEFILTPIAQGTRFNYNLTYEFMLDDVTPEEAEAFKRKQKKSSQDVFDVIFPRLKAMSEK